MELNVCETLAIVGGELLLLALTLWTILFRRELLAWELRMRRRIRRAARQAVRVLRAAICAISACVLERCGFEVIKNGR